MNEPPFFTVLTASLNNQTTLLDNLYSVKNQTFRKVQHIVIDGDSKDGTVEILQQLEDTYDLSWISEPDRGISEALNKGLPLAFGRYIIVMHADDRFIDPNILQKVYFSLNNEEIDILSYPVVMEDAARGIVFRNTIRCPWWIHFKFIFQHQGCFVHRRVFERIGGFREEIKIAMDYDFFYRALKKKCSVRFENYPVVVMGGEGIGSREENIPFRIKEEGLVHRINEQNKIWRLAQIIFRLFYVPYKLRSLPASRATFNKPEKNTD